MTRIHDLAISDEILGWMKCGMALKQGRHADGSLFRYVPLRACVAAPDDLSKFIGTVVSNDPELQVITINLSYVGRTQSARGDSLQALIAYPVLQRLRRLSKIHYEPGINSPLRPTVVGKDRYPYRIVEEIALK